MHGWKPGRYVFWQGKKAEIVLILFRDSRYLFVSGSWFCQIQTTRLNVFFTSYFASSPDIADG